jgi:hypothetical protein
VKRWSIADMDPPLQAAVRLAGGRAPFFRKLGLASRPGWTTTPQDRLFQVAQLTGIPPQELRPDLADWIEVETEWRRLAASEGGASLVRLGASVRRRWEGPELGEGLTDLWASLGAVFYVARLRGMDPQQVYAGKARFEEAARAYAMALAKVVGRARSTHIANVFRCSRQNVDNATERYLRARDGDDPDDYITGQFPDQAPRVLERGANRLRRAKAASAELWDAEAAFAAFLTAQQLQLPQPERRRA